MDTSAVTLPLAAPLGGATDDRTPKNGATAASLARGASIGRYLVLTLIGRGGMGDVYAAFDPELNRRVAIKLLHTSSGYESARKLLVREARALGQLSHPNVVQVHDVGEHDGDVFVAMELVEGESLDPWCVRPPKPSWQQVLAAYIDAARGLSAAHAKGIIHRDIKPANILRGTDGRVRVVDFGIAVGHGPSSADSASTRDRADFAMGEAPATSSPVGARLTEAGVVVGTPMYMAPEQLEKDGASPASDQYALCASLYEGLYGASPFTLEPPLDTQLVKLFAAKALGEIVPPPAGSPVPAWIWRALARGLAPRPGDRYPSMEALVAALSQDPAAPARAFRRFVAIGAAAGAFFVIGAAGWARTALRDPCARPEQHLAGVWDDSVKARVRAAFAGTGRADAEATTSRTFAALDRQAAAYAAMRGEVCEASRAGRQRPEILDLRDACLARRRGELEALATLLAEKPDPRVLDRAAAAAASLHPIDYCADTEALTARVRPPEDRALRARVAAIQPRVDRLETMYATGKLMEGLALAGPLRDEVDAIPYAPLHAQVRFWIGRFSEGTGDYDTAKASFRDAAIAAADGGDDVMVANAWARLFFVVVERQRRFDEAEVIRSLGIVPVTRAHDERTLGTWVNAEGLLLWRTGRTAEARATFERALAIREKALGPEHPDVASTLMNLALPLEDMGDYAQAKAASERALALYEKVVGPDHPDVARSLSNLGLVLLELAEYKRGVALFDRALAIRERTIGMENPDVAQTLGNLCLVLPRVGDLPRANAACERALRIQEKVLGLDHAWTGRAVHNLGILRLISGDYPAALAAFDRAGAIYDKAHEEDASLALADTVDLLLETGDAARAEPLARRALAEQEKAFARDSLNTTPSLVAMGRVAVALGKLDEAGPLLERALAVREKVFGPSHPAVAAARLGLGELALARRRPDEAAATLELAAAHADLDLRPHVESTLAEALWQAGKDRGRARAVAEQARASYEALGHAAGVARQTRWLATHR